MQVYLKNINFKNKFILFQVSVCNIFFLPLFYLIPDYIFLSTFHYVNYSSFELFEFIFNIDNLIDIFVTNNKNYNCIFEDLTLTETLTETILWICNKIYSTTNYEIARGFNFFQIFISSILNLPPFSPTVSNSLRLFPFRFEHGLRIRNP